MDAHTWYASLNHGGLLIAPSRILQFFPEAPEPLSSSAEEKLRRALTRFESENGEASTLVLDTVLEDVLGLGHRFRSDSGSWLKGSAVPHEWTRPAVTGEPVKPRRVWQAANGAVLPVFVDSEARIGIGRGRRASARVVEWLRRTEHRLALLTNARQWRIVYAGLDYDAFAEADTALWFEEGEAGAQVTALRTLLGPEALIPKDKGQLPRLLEAIETSRKGQAELSADLGERVRQAVELLIQSHGPAVAKAKERNVSPREIYLAATRIVMRMVVVLFAEARNLLPQENAIYHDSYGLQGLREALDRVGGEGSSSERLRHRYGAWARVLALFRLVYDGSPHESLPVLEYGGGLFEAGSKDSSDPVLRALTFFEDPETAPDDGSVHRILTLLTKSRIKVRQGKTSTFVTTPVDFSDLSSEYIGILYEGLLNYELRRVDENDAVVFLALGDEPALPLSRLVAMEDRAVAALVEKAKKGSKLASAEEDEEEGEEDEEESEEEDVEAAAPEEEEESTVEETEEEAAEDERQKVRDRARAWAERAVVQGKLVSKPPKKSAEAQRAYREAVERVAKSLVSRTVLPGEWFLVRFGGTRKGTGTFYTKPQLAVPTVHRTLRPLAYDPPKDEEGNPNEDAPPAEWTPKKPEDILALKVCDPACGSGSFLVASLRFLTEALLESLHFHKRIQEQGENTLVTLAEGKPSTGALTEELLPCRPDAPDFDSRLRAQLKRWVVELCLYGVDIDPLAVELCHLALWVETMDRNLPFSFLDHKIKCGNSIVGCWFDRFRDYPPLAWKREGGDKNHTKGVHFEKEAWTKAITEFRERLKRPLADWIVGQGRLFEMVDGKTPDEIHDEALRLFENMHALPIQDAQARTTFYREKIEGSESLTRLKQAFDTWCAIWFWPADRIECAPMPKELGEPSEEARRVVRELDDEYGFFHWELEFPDVFRAKDSGFDALLGNPPWEIQKPNSKEFFSNIDPLYRSYGKQEALDKQGEYFAATGDAELNWLLYNARFKALSNWSKHVGSPFGDGGGNGATFALGKKSDSAHELWKSRRQAYKTYSDSAHPFRWQGSADINTYKMFLEVAHALARPDGHLGLLVPSGIYTDKGSTDLRVLFLTHCRWKWLFSFENRDKIFDIDSRFKFGPVIVQKGGTTDAIRTAFMHRDLKDWEDAEKHAIPYSREQLEMLSPLAHSFFEISSTTDASVLAKLFASRRVFAYEERTWGLKFTRELDKTNDSRMLRSRHWMEARGLLGPDDDPRDESARLNLLEKGFAVVWEGKNCRFETWPIRPDVFIQLNDGIKYVAGSFPFGVRRIARNTDERTLIGCIVPPVTPTMYTIEVCRGLSRPRALFIYALVTSYCLDFVVRFQVASSVALSNLEALPLPRSDGELANVVAAAVDKVLEPTPFLAETYSRRASLEALVAKLYGLKRDDFRWVLRDCDHPRSLLGEHSFTRKLDPKGFWRIDKDKDPEIRQPIISLAAFQDLDRAIEAHGDALRGMRAFMSTNNGEGWCVPESLTLSEIGLGHDSRASAPQPVYARLNESARAWPAHGPTPSFWQQCRLAVGHALGSEHSGKIATDVLTEEEYGIPKEAPIAAERSAPFDAQGELFSGDKKATRTATEK